MITSSPDRDSGLGRCEISGPKGILHEVACYGGGRRCHLSHSESMNINIWLMHLLKCMRMSVQRHRIEASSLNITDMAKTYFALLTAYSDKRKLISPTFEFIIP